MEKNKVVEGNETKIVSIKRFLIFSLIMVPVWFYWFFYLEKIVKNAGLQWLLFPFSYILFAFINWVAGQKKVAWPIAIAINILTFIWFSWGYFVIPGIWGFLFEGFGFLVLYLIFIFIVMFLQFGTWLPFLFKYTYLNRGRLKKLKWE